MPLRENSSIIAPSRHSPLVGTVSLLDSLPIQKRKDTYRQTGSAQMINELTCKSWRRVILQYSFTLIVHWLHF